MNDAGQPNDDVFDACRQEIIDLHQFFEGWLRGTFPETDEAFARLERALSPDFQLIHPSGQRRSRDDILSGLRRAHGSEPSLTIEIDAIQVHQTGATLLLATYEEWQRTSESEDGRLSTVVFSRGTDEPDDLQWRHVHETWVQAPA